MFDSWRIVTFVSCLVCVIGSSGCSSRNITVNDLEYQIQQELPVGSDVTQVVQYLETKGIEHSSYMQSERTILGIVRGTSMNWPISGSITLRFVFDEHGKLARHEVKEVFTGP